MYEANVKQAFVVRLPLAKGFINTVPVEYDGVYDEDIPVSLDEEPDAVEVPVEDDGDSFVVSSGDAPGSPVSSGDVSGSDISAGDVSGGSASVSQVYTTCVYEPKPKLWESDVSDYDTTDGLLLLILVFTVINAMANVFFRRW